MPQMDRWAPKPTGVRDPRDSAKKNGMFHNWPRFLFFGGVQQKFSQMGTKRPDMSASSGQGATGPVSDRGKGR